jgi:hypothetical protein
MTSSTEADFYCPSCSAPAFDETTFCTGCGADLRYVQRAMGGGLTARQRRFVGAMTMAAVSVQSVASMIATAWVGPLQGFTLIIGLLSSGILVGSLGYAGYLLARDGSSRDPLFRLPHGARKQLSAPTKQR